MQELEKRVVSNLHRLDILNKKAQEQGKADVEALTESLNTATEAKQKFDEAMNSADDVVASDSLPEEEEEANKAEVINDLRDMVVAALAENNIKLAYKIERTIDEILEQEVKCEL